ncbi:MAG: 3-dehydroquinate synthase [Deltaproteobacteria bacterium]|nr:3-dehydroquinate synthase [Deltaproteobacteria bacterium]
MKKLVLEIERKGTVRCEITIGYDIMDRVGLLLAKEYGKVRSFMVTDDRVADLYGAQITDGFRKMGMTTSMIVIPAGEASKNVDTALFVIGEMLKGGADRSSVLIAFGGGVVGDLTGFVASIYMRGIPYIQIPTTLMAQVDSSIGGKTAVDLPEGKNLIGSFHQPGRTYIDLKFLETLPEKEMKNGLTEIIKAAIIEDITLFNLLESEAKAVKERDRLILTQIVEKACRVKRGIVELDERERGLRRILNFGHTLGHAIEAESGYRMSHGEAVSIGMVAATRIAEKIYDLPPSDRQRIESLIGALGHPTTIGADISTEGILARLKMDKKKMGDTVHFVLIKKIGFPFVNGAIESGTLRDIIEELRS